MQLLFDFVDDRAHQPRVGSARDHEGVDDADDVTDVEDDDVFTLLGVGGPGRESRRFLDGHLACAVVCCSHGFGRCDLAGNEARDDRQYHDEQRADAVTGALLGRNRSRCLVLTSSITVAV